MNTQYPQQRTGSFSVPHRTEAVSGIERVFMQKVYGWMAGGLALSASTAVGIAVVPDVQAVIFNSTILLFGLIIGQFILVGALSGWVHRMSSGTAMMCFVGYAILTGITLSTVFLVFSTASVVNIFLVSSAMFGGMSVFGMVTRRDLSSWGSFFFMGLVGIVLAGVVNIFLNSSMMSFVISVVAVLVFTGLTAYDTQNIKEMAVLEAHDGALASNYAILGALTLYLDFINLFLALLRLFGDRD